MPSLSLNIGLNNGRKLHFGGGVVFPNVGADGQQISVTALDSSYNGIYTKYFDEFTAQFVSASTMYNGPYASYYYAKLLFNAGANQWEIGGVSDPTGNGYEWIAFSSNPSSNQNVIPTTGWSPSITITAV
jgi:hypothetical protein